MYESHKLSCFLSGLKNELRLPMRMLGPKNLNKAFGISKIQEEYLWSIKTNSRVGNEGLKPSILGTPKIDIKLVNQARVSIEGSFVEVEHLSNGGMQKERTLLQL